MMTGTGSRVPDAGTLGLILHVLVSVVVTEEVP